MQMLSFAQRIEAFNKMYRLPIGHKPLLSWSAATLNPKSSAEPSEGADPIIADWSAQVANFLKIMREELDEVDDILEMFEEDDDIEVDIGELDILTAVADWLGDIAVYSMSEATKYGVADYVPNYIYCDHAAVGSIYGDTEDIEAALLAIGEGLVRTVEYNEGVLVGQPSAKSMAKFLSTLIGRCFHEAEHFGFDLYDILEIIMDSNMSKLGEDGNPIYDERGKVMKGPNYWKPEPKIRAYLASIYTVDDEEEELSSDEDAANDEDNEDEENAR